MQPSAEINRRRVQKDHIIRWNLLDDQSFRDEEGFSMAVPALFNSILNLCMILILARIIPGQEENHVVGHA